MTKIFFWLKFFLTKKIVNKFNKKNCDQPKKKHRENCKKLPWELAGCQGDKKSCDKTRKLKLWEEKNLKTQIVIKLKKLKLWQNSKTETETKHKNFKCEKIQKLKLWQNSKRKLWQNSNWDKTQIVTKLKNWNCDKTWKLKLWQD